MRRSNGGAISALHPILFFIVVYGISLFLAFFICSAVYNSLHPGAADTMAAQAAQPADAYQLQAGAMATAMR